MTKNILLIFALLLLTSSCAEHKSINNSADINCQTLQACLRQISKVEHSKYGISEQAVSLAEKFPKFGDAALVALIALLKSNDPHILELVGYAISSFESIDPKYFPSIKYGIEKNVPWLPRALGSIPSTEAAEYAVKIYLKAPSSPGNQEAVGVTRQGERALPYIISETLCDEKCDQRKLDLLVHITGEMEPSVKVSLSKRILAKLKSPEISKPNKRNLIGLFFKMGEPAKFAEDQLHQIAQETPDLGLAINDAYIGIRSQYSGGVFAQYLKSSPDIYVIRDLAKMGPAGKDAAPALVDLLSQSDRDIRLGAARALGYLQYEKAVPALIPLLNEMSDVRLNLAAAESLGMIGRPEALAALMNASKSHWNPRVRESAAKAWHKIKYGKEGEMPVNNQNFAFDFFSFQFFNVKSCKKVSLRSAQENTLEKLNRTNKRSEREKLAYDSYIISYGPDDEEEQKNKDPKGIVVVNRYNMVEHREAIKQVPDVALKVDNGWLTGSDRGEWGGELVYLTEDGQAVKLLDTNVEDIYKLGEKYIALTGLSHLFINEGLIYQLHKQDNEWHAEPWVNLPGAPESSWFVETGELLINTSGGGSILISPEGNLRMAPCE